MKPEMQGNEAAEHLMVADLAMWAGDSLHAESTLRELVRDGFVRLPRIEPASINDWVSRVAEMRLRQLFYRRGRERRVKVENASLATERTMQRVWSDTQGLLRMTGVTVSPERLQIRGYLTKLDERTRERIRANFEAAPLAHHKSTARRESQNQATSSSEFALRIAHAHCVGRFHFTMLGTISGEIVAVPSIEERKTEVEALFQEFMKTATAG